MGKSLDPEQHVTLVRNCVIVGRARLDRSKSQVFGVEGEPVFDNRDEAAAYRDHVHERALEFEVREGIAYPRKEERPAASVDESLASLRAWVEDYLVGRGLEKAVAATQAVDIVGSLTRAGLKPSEIREQLEADAAAHAEPKGEAVAAPEPEAAPEAPQEGEPKPKGKKAKEKGPAPEDAEAGER